MTATLDGYGCATLKLVGSHHDDWLPGFSIPTSVGRIREELARQTTRVELVETGYLEGLPLFARRSR